MPSLRVETLIEHMDGPYPIGGESRRIDRALIMPSASVNSLEPQLSFREQHELVIQACRRYPDRLAGNFMYNPALPAEDAVSELERLVRDEGFRAVKLHPTIHGYAPARVKDRVWPVLEAAQSLDLGVLIHTGDPPFAYPLAMEPLAEAFPDLRIVLAHFGIQRVILAEEAIAVARSHDNVWIETSCANLGNLKQGIRVLGAGKLMYGSDAPFHDMYSQLRPIEVLCHKPPFGINLSEADRERIFGGNAAEVFRL
jgi:predicted TIM-barrel fold metal-dependent hydrolase